MQLLSHLISFFQPTGDLGIEISYLAKAKVVRVTSWSESLNLVEAIVFDSTRQNKMTDKMVLAWHRSGKTHSDLENHPRLLRNHVYPSTRAHLPRELLK